MSRASVVVILEGLTANSPEVDATIRAMSGDSNMPLPVLLITLLTYPGTGGDGNDRLFWNDEKDTLRGGAGSDLISAGFGRDLLFFNENRVFFISPRSGIQALRAGSTGSAMFMAAMIWLIRHLSQMQ